MLDVDDKVSGGKPTNLFSFLLFLNKNLCF